MVRIVQADSKTKASKARKVMRDLRRRRMSNGPDPIPMLLPLLLLEVRIVVRFRARKRNRDGNRSRYERRDLAGRSGEGECG